MCFLSSAFTRSRGALQAAEQLQSVGVPAYPVQNSPDLLTDPQLDHLRYFCSIGHPLGGTSVVESARVHFSRTPAQVPMTVPTFNAAMQQVLGDLLGYSDDRIAQLQHARVLG